jgi:hypothetical protein
MAVGAAAVAVIIAKEKHIVETFRRAGAVDAQSALAPASIGVAERLAFRKLRQHAVLREATPGRYYLDELSWEALRGLRRRLGLVWLIVVALAALATWLGVR